MDNLNYKIVYIRSYVLNYFNKWLKENLNSDYFTRMFMLGLDSDDIFIEDKRLLNKGFIGFRWKRHYKKSYSGEILSELICLDTVYVNSDYYIMSNKSKYVEYTYILDICFCGMGKKCEELDFFRRNTKPILPTIYESDIINSVIHLDTCEVVNHIQQKNCLFELDSISIIEYLSIKNNFQKLNENCHLNTIKYEVYFVPDNLYYKIIDQIFMGDMDGMIDFYIHIENNDFCIADFLKDYYNRFIDLKVINSKIGITFDLKSLPKNIRETYKNDIMKYTSLLLNRYEYVNILD